MVADYQRLLAAHPTLAGVIHGWRVMPESSTECFSSASLPATALASCSTLLALVQALGDQRKPPLWLVTQGTVGQQIYNSRTTTFASQIMADTNGQGVDIVLNTLTGPGFIEQSLACLAPNGYFMEISKRDVWSAEQMAAVRPDVAYHLVDLVDVGQNDLPVAKFLATIQERIKSRSPAGSCRYFTAQCRKKTNPPAIIEMRLRP